MEFSINDGKFLANSRYINLPYAQGCLTVYQRSLAAMNYGAEHGNNDKKKGGWQTPFQFSLCRIDKQKPHLY